MSTRKFLDSVTTDEPNLTIITADGGRIQAHSEVLRLVCSCLKNAPATDTWDLQHLQIEGTPVTTETVDATVEVLYHVMHVVETDLPENRFSLLQLRDMLLFADAIGCSKRMLNSIAALIEVCCRKQLEVAAAGQVPSELPGAAAVDDATAQDGQNQPTRQHVVALHMGRVYTIDRRDLCEWVANAKRVVFKFDSKSVQPFLDDFAAQMESLLHVSFRLDVQPLVSLALGFVQHNSAYGILQLQHSSTFLTPRVLTAVAGSSMGGSLLAHVMMQVPLGPGIGLDTVFCDYGSDALKPFTFEATLARDLLDFKKGSRVRVTFNLTSTMLKLESLPAADDDIGPTNVYFGVVLGFCEPHKDPGDIRLQLC
eukprot:GHUV01009971.1.p1 GENE.GHUV01009971.1~~GHUV01009971.1.p1  ORF type:complete len:368 (+),score=59.18 GHUV01009971.1:220-1323(+)